MTKLKQKLCIFWHVLHQISTKKCSLFTFKKNLEEFSNFQGNYVIRLKNLCMVSLMRKITKRELFNNTLIWDKMLTYDLFNTNENMYLNMLLYFNGFECLEKSYLQIPVDEYIQSFTSSPKKIFKFIICCFKNSTFIIHSI